MGYPLIHIAVGRTADNKIRVAKGVIAIGQFAIGLITIAQFGVGFLFGFGQLMFGFTAVAQVAIAAYFGLGQIATGYTAIGQVAFGHFLLAQAGYGTHIWSTTLHDPIALEYFHNLFAKIGIAFGHSNLNNPKQLPK